MEEIKEDSLIKMITTHEGLRLKPYKCTSGKLTIGVGRNLDDKGITEEEALYLLKHDIRDAIDDLNTALPFAKDMTIMRKEVLIDMCFNLGITRLLKFKKMLRALKDGDYNKAANEMMDSLWALQVGNRAKDLAQMMRKGV